MICRGASISNMYNFKHSVGYMDDGDRHSYSNHISIYKLRLVIHMAPAVSLFVDIAVFHWID